MTTTASKTKTPSKKTGKPTPNKKDLKNFTTVYSNFRRALLRAISVSAKIKTNRIKHPEEIEQVVGEIKTLGSRFYQGYRKYYGVTRTSGTSSSKAA
jgi:hypothetical protein